eukprot:445567-Pyramimonas_sp.AAC.1
MGRCRHRPGRGRRAIHRRGDSSGYSEPRTLRCGLFCARCCPGQVLPTASAQLASWSARCLCCYHAPAAPHAILPS